jgi:predicted RNase H-like HicB family nuclease
MSNKILTKQVRSFTAFFDRNKNGSYTVTVPSLPGLVTEGNTLEEARKMAEDAIQCYIEGLKKDREEIPEETESAQMRILVTA